MAVPNGNSKKNIKRWVIAGSIAFIGLIMFFFSISSGSSDVSEILFFYLGFIIFTSAIAGIWGSKNGAVVGFFLGFVVIQIFTSFLEVEPWDGFSVFMRGLFGGLIGSAGGGLMGKFIDRIPIEKINQPNICIKISKTTVTPVTTLYQLKRNIVLTVEINLKVMMKK